MITPPVSRLDFQHFAVCPRASCGGSVPFLASIWSSERLLIREEGRVQASRRHPGNLGFRQGGNITAFLSVSMAYGGVRKPPRFVGLRTLPNPEQGMRIHGVGRTSRLQMG